MAFALRSPTSAPLTGSDHDTAAPWAPPELRVVCLDLDDTLIDFSAASRRSLELIVGNGDSWELWERITDEHVELVVQGELEYAEVHTLRTQAFFAELGIMIDFGTAAELEVRRKAALKQSWRLFDDVEPCLEWLAAAGVRLAVVTNASGAHQHEKLAMLGLTRYFDHVAIAGELGVAKPDPAIFQAVCFALGCDPSDAVHVGDKLATDAIGARDAGLAGVWLNRGGVAADVPSDVYELSDLTSLPELLVSEFARVGVPAPR